MTNEEEEYVTLFCEGDGGVYITPDGYPKVSFGQMECDVLDYVNSLAEDGITCQRKDGLWQIEFNGSNCIELLEIFSKHVVGKVFLGRLNIVLEHVDMPSAVQHPLTLTGFVGFWDAEGSSGNNPTIFVSQKDREILDIIVEMFGGGVSRFKNRNGEWMYHWYLTGEKARTLHKVVLERSHCPGKSERLRKNFEGPTYYVLNREECPVHVKQYNEGHKDERQAYRDANKDKHITYDKKRYAQQKLVREYMKTHPEAIQ